MHLGKLYIALTAVLLIAGSNVYAGKNIDSLLNKLKNNPESGRSDILNSLSEAYLQKSIDTALLYANNAYSNASKSGNIAEKAAALNSLGMCSETIGNYQKALEYYQEALILRQQTGNKSEIAKCYNNIGIIYFDLSNYSKALEYYQNSLRIREELGNRVEIAKSLNNIGLLYLRMKDYNQALIYWQRLLDLHREGGTKSDIASSYSYLGYVYYCMGKIDIAIDYYQRELKIRTEIGDIDKLDAFLNNIGMMYYSVQKYDKAVEYYNKAIEIIKKKGDNLNLAKTYLNLGNVYYDKSDYARALDFYRKSLSLTKERGSKKGMAALLNNIGLVNKAMGNYKEALTSCLESIKIKNEIGDSSNLFYPYTSIAEIYLKLKNYEMALFYLNKAQNLSYGTNDKQQMKSAYFLYYEVYDAPGKYKQLLKYHLLYTNVKDTLISEQTNKSISELVIKYDTEKKEQENKSLRKVNEIQRNSFIIISSLILILLLVLVNRYRSKQKANNKLSEMNKKINAQHNELERTYQQLQAKEERLRDANATKDKFFTIIAHDLRNPLQAIILSSDLLINKFKIMDGEQLIELINNINRSGTHLANLLTNLLQWSRTQTGKIEFNPDKILLGTLVNDNVNLLSPIAEKKNIELSAHVDDTLPIYADANMATTIIRNLLSNAVKFTGKNGKIKIASNFYNGMVEVSISDSGIGLSKEDIKKLFRIDVHNATIGHSSEKGTGLGLILCKEFVEINGGQIWVESVESKGSTFKFTLPVYTGASNQPIRSLADVEYLFAGK